MGELDVAAAASRGEFVSGTELRRQLQGFHGGGSLGRAGSIGGSEVLGSGPGGCTITNCEGINLLAAIRADLEPWRRRGGIILSDTDRAQVRGCPVGEEDGHYFGCVAGWVRVMVLNGTLYATHFGEGFGTRDGVFLVAILELLARYGRQVPDVDFVLQPGDRAKLTKHTHPDGAKWLPLMLGFAVHPDYQEIGIPDPSFWGWPEMAVPPHWELTRSPDIVPWFKKEQTAFWRGGSNRRFAQKVAHARVSEKKEVRTKQQVTPLAATAHRSARRSSSAPPSRARPCSSGSTSGTPCGWRRSRT